MFATSLLSPLLVGCGEDGGSKEGGGRGAEAELVVPRPIEESEEGKNGG